MFLSNLACTALAAQVYKLDSGQTVVIQEVRSNPIVTIDTWIKTGSINETDENNGVAHFLEHLFFKGTTKHPAGEFDRILENKGAQTNAATSKDFTHYYITIPSKDFETALNLHADMLLNPLIPRKELEMERKVVLEEIAKDKNSPAQLVHENLTKLLYQKHPYKRDVIGTNHVISTIEREKILQFYDSYYTPSNMITVITGDIDAQTALDAVKKEFDAPAAVAAPKEYPVYDKEPPLTEQKRTVAHFPAQSGYMLIGFRTVPADGSDTYALDVLAAILGEGRSSVFYQNIKEQKQLAVTISAVNMGMKDDGIFYINANFKPENVQKLESAIFSEIAAIQKQGVTPAQLNLAKNLLERDTYYSRESTSNIASEIGYTITVAGDIRFYDNYINNIKKVTAADVKRAANKYLQNSAVSIVLPEQNNEKPVSHKTAAADVAPVNLIITPNDSNDIVAISIHAVGGRLLEDTPGTADLMAALLSKGTKNYSATQFAKTLEDNGIKIVPEVTPDAIEISVLTTKKDYKKAVEMLDEVINNAVFPESELEKTRTEKLHNIKRSRDIPMNLAVEGYKTLIFEGSPYSASNKVLEKTLPKVTREEILDYYERIFTPMNIVVSVNGNVDETQVKSDFNKMFRSAFHPASSFKYSLFEIPQLRAPKTAVSTIKDAKTDWIILGWQAPGLLDKKDYVAMELLDAMLGSGMSSRLFKRLRVESGLAYQVGSQYGANVLRGAFIVFIGTNPDNLELAQRRMLEEVYRFKTEFAGTKELADAKEKLIGQFIVSQETNLDKASTLGWFEASGRGKGFGAEYEKLINSVTVTDIMNTANKYFTGNFVTSIVK